MQTDAKSLNIVGFNNVGSCWWMFHGAWKRTQQLPTSLAIGQRSDAFWDNKAHSDGRNKHPNIVVSSTRKGATCWRYASLVTATISNSYVQVTTSTNMPCKRTQHVACYWPTIRVVSVCMGLQFKEYTKTFPCSEYYCWNLYSLC